MLLESWFVLGQVTLYDQQVGIFSTYSWVHAILKVLE